MKIYIYYDGKIHELEVRKTQQKYIAVKGLLAFGCKRSFWQNEVHLTPEAALDAAKEDYRVKISMLRTRKCALLTELEVIKSIKI